MKLLKDYKGVILIYIVITLFNVLWVVNYDKIDEQHSTVKEKNIVDIA